MTWNPSIKNPQAALLRAGESIRRMCTPPASCEHKNADHLMPGEWFNRDEIPLYVADVEQFRCIDCGAWLSLGPSNDRIPYRETWLAERLAQNVLLWSIPAQRKAADAVFVEAASEIADINP